MRPLPTMPKLATTIAAVLLVTLGVSAAPAGAGVPTEPQGERPDGERTVTGSTPYHGVLQYRAKDAKLALVRPSFVTAEEAKLPAGVAVVGVSVEGVHRAYPLYILKNHQVVNDHLGDVPIAASW